MDCSLLRPKIAGTLHEDQYTFSKISRTFLLRMENVSDKICRENQNTHFVFSNFFFPPKNRAVYEITWKNIVEPDRTQMIWRMRTACWIPKAKNTNLQYVTRIAFPLQQWLHLCCFVLRYMYIACLVMSNH